MVVWFTNLFYYEGNLIFAGSVINLCLLGVAYFGSIHHIAYFIMIQIFGGIMQVRCVNQMGAGRGQGGV